MDTRNFPTALWFNSIEEWDLFCQEVGGIIPVYFWKGTYREILEKGHPVGEHGAERIYYEIHTIAHYELPNGLLSHHREARHGEQTYNRTYWTFAAKGESPQEVDQVGETGAMLCIRDERHTISHYKAPNGLLSHHWEVHRSGQSVKDKAYWSFEVTNELPQDLDLGSGYRLQFRFHRQTDRPGLYEVMTESGVPYYSTPEAIK